MSLAIPIVLIVANITMLVLTLVSHKKYIRYAVFQLVICFLSMLPLYFILQGLVRFRVLGFVSMGVSVVNFLVTVCLCARDIKDTLVRKFHL